MRYNNAQEKSEMKYFVTGATGFVGGHVARQLVKDGHEVVAVVRNPGKAGELAQQGITLHRGDVTDKESMRGAMRGVDGVFHIAGWYKVGTRDKEEGRQINVQGTRNVLELMKELGVARGVYTSTLAVNSDTGGKIVDESYRYKGPHLSVYDESKWQAHYEVAEPMMAEGLPLVVVMPGLIYGPGDTSSARATLVQYLKRRLPLVPRKTAYSWAHVVDIARGHILAMERGRTGESYIIAGPSHTLIDALQLAEKATGVPGPPLKVSPGPLKAASAVVRVVEKVVPVPQDYSSEFLRVSAGVTYLGNNAKAKRELGYNPRPLEEGLPATLHHEMRLLGMTK